MNNTYKLVGVERSVRFVKINETLGVITNRIDYFPPELQ